MATAYYPSGGAWKTWTADMVGAVPTSGGTFSGDIGVSKTGAVDTKVTVTNTETKKSVSLMVGSGKVNRGVYDHVKNAWMVYADTNNTVYLNGNATYATSAGTANSVAWANVSGKPTIPSVGNGTITITQAGTTKGTFTVNQSGNTTIALTDNNTVYTHPTSSGNKHIPSGGSSGQFLGWSSDGTAKWVGNPNTNTVTVRKQSSAPTQSDCLIWIKA